MGCPFRSEVWFERRSLRTSKEFLTAPPFVSRSKTPPLNEPPCREQLKGDSFSVLEMRVKRGRLEISPHSLPVDSQKCTKMQAQKYPVCWVDRKRRSCFCDKLCRRGSTIAESWAKRFAHTANEPVSRRRNWPSGLTCTTISLVKSSVGTWRFHWARAQNRKSLGRLRARPSPRPLIRAKQALASTEKGAAAEGYAFKLSCE